MVSMRWGARCSGRDHARRPSPPRPRPRCWQARVLVAATIAPASGVEPVVAATTATAAASFALVAVDVATPSRLETWSPMQPLAQPTPTLAEICFGRVRGTSLWGVSFGISALATPERAAVLARLEREIERPDDSAGESCAHGRSRAAGAPASPSSAAVPADSPRRPWPLARLRMLQALHAIVVDVAHNLQARPEDVYADVASKVTKHAPWGASHGPLPPSGVEADVPMRGPLPLSERCCRELLRIQARHLIGLLDEESPVGPHDPLASPAAPTSAAAVRARAAADFLFAVLVDSGNARAIAATDWAARAEGGGGDSETVVGSGQRAELAAGGGARGSAGGGQDGSGGGSTAKYGEDTLMADASAVVRCYRRTTCSLGAAAVTAAAAVSDVEDGALTAQCAPQREACVLCNSPVQVSARFLQGHRCGNGHVRSRCWLCFETVRLVAWKCNTCGGRACSEHDTQPAAMLGPLRAVSPLGICGLCGSRCEQVSHGVRGVTPM